MNPVSLSGHSIIASQVHALRFTASASMGSSAGIQCDHIGMQSVLNRLMYWKFECGMGVISAIRLSLKPFRVSM